jgi:Fe-S-cluster-containing dehydrogenase component
LSSATQDTAKSANGSDVPSLGHIKVKDKKQCIGCGNCMLVCSLVHDGETSLSLARIYIDKDLFSGDYRQETCAQCKKPKCLPACPVEGALTVDQATGAKVINAELCIGCRACEESCIFAASRSRVKYDPKKNICVKCDLCGGDPECVKVCPVSILACVSHQ